MTILHKLNAVPKLVEDGLCYLATCGSIAYGTNNEDSDIDLVGIYMPPKQYLYPQDYGFIQGFSEPQAIDEVCQVHHVYDEAGKEYDINIFNIIKFFKLAKQGNPNILDMIFVKPELHLFKNVVGKTIYEARSLFVSKDMYHKFRGMVKNHIMGLRKVKTVGRRAGLVDKFGYDTKDAGHAIRIQYALVSLLEYGTYEVDEKASLITDIRNGMYPVSQIEDLHRETDTYLEGLIKTSKIADHVNEVRIHQLLQHCIDIYYKE